MDTITQVRTNIDRNFSIQRETCYLVGSKHIANCLPDIGAKENVIW